MIPSRVVLAAEDRAAPQETTTTSPGQIALGLIAAFRTRKPSSAVDL
jgi:hypothetical protein